MCTASQIKETRVRLGESQATFAERFGIDQSTLHRWETDGPPERGPARKMVELVLSGLDPQAMAG